MTRLDVSEDARLDLSIIYRNGFLTFGLKQADQYIDGLLETLDVIADYPEIARLRDGIDPPFRAYPYRSRVTLYDLKEDGGVMIVSHPAWVGRLARPIPSGRILMTHPIHIGIGGWTYEPWRGVFYPPDLTQKRELEYASRALTSIEINGTYYSTFKPDSWIKWREETPDGFVFSVKASRYCTNRKVLSDGKESFDRFLDQGLTLLGPKLGPINWQFMATKKFDPVDFEGFLKLLPHEKDGLRLRHALEVRSSTFDVPQFHDLAAKYAVAIVYAEDDEEPTWPRIDRPTADFTYARLMSSREEEPTGMTSSDMDGIAKQTRAWAKRGQVFAYFISGAKVRNPAAAQALIARLN